MKTLSLLIVAFALSVSFVNCGKKGLAPENPTNFSKDRTPPKDSIKKTLRVILKPDSVKKH